MNFAQKIAFVVACKEIGQKEVPGIGSNPRILEYHQATSLHATSDEVPWCSSFMNWCFKQAGALGTNNAMARSWLLWGTKVDDPQAGDVVIFARGTDGVSGHVGFVYENTSMLNPLIKVLGGNQKDSVCVQTFLKTRILGYRRMV